MGNKGKQKKDIAETKYRRKRTIIRQISVVAKNKASARETALLWRQENLVEGADEARVTGGDEEDERSDEDG